MKWLISYCTVVADMLAMDVVLELLECPVCSNHATVSIYQCSKGHILCSECWHKVSACPICRGPKEDIRCLALENLASKFIFPCRFHVHGCNERMRPLPKGVHEQACLYKPISCPLPFGRCKWTGPTSDVAKHVCVHHKASLGLKGQTCIMLSVVLAHLVSNVGLWL